MMTGKNGHEAVSEATTYLLPKDPHSPKQSAVHRPVNKAQSAEEGREYFPTPTTKQPAAAEVPPTLLEQACAALFYASASLLVIFVNKVGVGASRQTCGSACARDPWHVWNCLAVGTELNPDKSVLVVYKYSRFSYNFSPTRLGHVPRNPRAETGPRHRVFFFCTQSSEILEPGPRRTARKFLNVVVTPFTPCAYLQSIYVQRVALKCNGCVTLHVG